MNIEKALINMCIDGNELACKQLYEVLLPYSCSLCRRYGVRSEDLKDQLQVIFSSMFLSLKNFDSEKAQFKTWFTKICVNKCVEAQRKKHLDIIQLENVLDGDIKHYKEIQIHDNLDKKYILGILCRMPEKYRTVFNMFVFDELNHQEISKMLNITQSKSRVTLMRARNWAKVALQNYLQSAAL